MIKLDDIKLEQTSFACPEQYDAFYKGKQVGYLRLRHGYFSVEYPDCMGELLYEAEPKGDGLFTDEERDYYLDKAKKAIILKLKDKI